MIHTISISIERVLESVYAQSALYNYVSDESRPAVLGRGQSRLLRRLLLDCMAQLICVMSPPAVATNLPECDDQSDVVTIDFEFESLPAGWDALRPAIENLLASQVMSTAWSGYNASRSQMYMDVYAAGVSMVRGVLVPVAGGLRIEPAA